ncbi:MAG: hypothetical protein ACK4SY_09770 [Pyrobaculum sp.]
MSETFCEFYGYEESTRFVARLVVEPGLQSPYLVELDKSEKISLCLLDLTVAGVETYGAPELYAIHDVLRVDKIGAEPPYGLDTYEIANSHAVYDTLRVEVRDLAPGMYVEGAERYGEYFDTSHLTVGKPLLATPGPTPTETVGETPRPTLDIEEITSCIRRVVNESQHENDLRDGVTHCIEEKVIKPLGIPVKIHHEYKLPGGRVDTLYEVSGVNDKVVVEYKRPGSTSYNEVIGQVIGYITQLPGDWTRHIGVIISDKIAFVWYDSTQKRWIRKGPFPISEWSTAMLVRVLLRLKETPQ